MLFTIRVDDIGWTQNPIAKGSPMKQADRGLHLAQRFHAAMQGLPYLAAIIPFPLDDEGKGWLKSKPENMTPALHGFTHRMVDTVASEYRGLSEDQCRDRIAAGRNILNECGCETDHTVLPFNKWEPNLKEAFYHEGIRHVWGGGDHTATAPSLWPTPPQPYPLGKLTFVPTWLPAYGVTVGNMSATDVPLKDSLPGLINRLGKVVLCLHITWEAAKSENFDGVRWLVDAIGDLVINVGEYLL